MSGVLPPREPSMSASLDLRDRAALFARLEAESFDVLVIGAGITGAGIARDASLRGLKVALVDARDFAAGTSSRSSKLVHGGIRYLAQGDIGLVREASSERTIVRRIAPHLAAAMPFIVRARSWAGITKFRTGLWTYEKLGGVAAEDRHELWDSATLAVREPAIRTEGLAGAIVYCEYLTDDSRLTLANVRAAAAGGAVVVNYGAVTGLLRDADTAIGAIVTDALSEGRAARVRCRCIVNAAGPWADRLAQLEDPAAQSRLQLTEGIHVVVPRARLPLTRTIAMTAGDKRGVFAIPRGHGVYLGTTDTFYAEPAYWPDIRADHVRYLLDAANASFDVPPLTPADVTSVWSGLRPLVAEAGKAPSEISRKDEVYSGPLGVITISGGKLTAYRKMAERVVDLCAKRLRATVRPVSTAEQPLPGGDLPAGVPGLIARLQKDSVTPEHAERLARLYGSEAPAVLALGGGPGAEAEWAVRHEGAVTLEDWWVRRSARAWFDRDGGEAALEPAAAAMGALLGWSDAVRKEQVESCLHIRRTSMASLAST